VTFYNYKTQQNIKKKKEREKGKKKNKNEVGGAN
jgi:hypothetical protein